jgi:hypothetical protein
MIAMELYDLLSRANIEYEVVEIFEGVRILSIEVDEEIDEPTDEGEQA